jgi:hypothetical protein
LIFVVALVAGAAISANWLPELAAGQVGGLAFFAVCGLIGAAFGLLGMHVYLIAEEIDHFPNIVGPSHGVTMAAGIRSICFDDGSLLGFAGVIYLLAPRAPEIDSVQEAAPVGEL